MIDALGEAVTIPLLTLAAAYAAHRWGDRINSYVGRKWWL